MYLEDNICKFRKLEIDGCVEYNPTEDSCSVCRDDFYLTEEGLTCMPNHLLGRV